MKCLTGIRLVAIFALTPIVPGIHAENINGRALVEEAINFLPEGPGEYGDSSVVGIDSDLDGVRDDIEIYLTKK